MKPLILQRIILERLSVGGENLKVVKLVFPPTVCPHHLLFSGPLGEFHAIRLADGNTLIGWKINVP